MTPLTLHLAATALGATVTDLSDSWDSTDTYAFSGTTRSYTGHSGAWVSGMDGDSWSTGGSNPNSGTLEPGSDLGSNGTSTWGSRGSVDNHITYAGREYRDLALATRYQVFTDDYYAGTSDACGLVFRWQSATDYYVVYSTNDRGPNQGTGGERSGAGTRLYRVRNGVATELWSSTTYQRGEWYDSSSDGYRWGQNRMTVSVSGTSPVAITIALDVDANGSADISTTVNDSSSDRIQTGGRVGLYAYNARYECNYDDVSVKIDDKDTDGDTIPDARDNCVSVANTDQKDLNGNRIGDACEDGDGDGYAPPADCNDADAAIKPGATEICDSIDQDCDGNLLEAFADFDGDKTADCIDPDDDNDGDPDTTDCNDFDKAYAKNAPESCDAIDHDCDGDLVDGFPNNDGDKNPDCVDADDDNDGSPDVSDCAPFDKNISPLATEVCDLVDQDCDGNVVESFPDTDTDLQPDCVDTDDDGDGDPDASDCNDTDRTVYNGAPESACDAVDSDCDGSIADGVAVDTDKDGTPDCTDLDDDNDGSVDASDCAPLDAAIRPGATEVCDAIDQDCDGNVVESFDNQDADALPDCADPDDDNDGSLDASDCAPLDKGIYPGAVEVCDLIDQDCDADVLESFGDFDKDKTPDCVDTDDDNDGDPDATDCDDANAAVSTKATESCDLVDSDCDGSLVDTFTDFDKDKTPDCVDADDDDDTDPDASDCADTDPDVSNLATEVCNGVDDDCSGVIDDDYAQGVKTWYADVDGDKVGDDTVFVVACAAPDGYLGKGGDCNDGDADVNPSAEETCRPGDDDCDGFADDSDPEGMPADTTEWFRDGDQDGYGDPDASFDACIQPDGYTDVTGATDCDDDDANVNPNTAEVCENGVDDDCDGTVDETVVLEWWPDADKDGYGDASATPVSDCAPPSADHVNNGDDCDDGDDAINPRADEVYGNDVDDDCNPDTPDVPDTDDPVDTGAPPDTDLAGDRPLAADTDLDTDTAAGLAGEACGCRSTGLPGGFAWLAALALVARRARRR